MRHVLLIALLAVLITSCSAKDDPYLDIEYFKLLVNGTVITTTKPLAPYTRYIIRISSPLDLRPFLWEDKGIFYSDFYWQFKWEGADASIKHNEKGEHGRTNHVVIEAQGAGKPFQIQTSKDFTSKFDAPALSLLILRSRWWRQDDGTIELPLLAICVVLGLIVLILVISFLHDCFAPATYSMSVIEPAPPRRQEPSVSVPIQTRSLPVPEHHQRFTLTPHTTCASPDSLPKGTELVVTIEGLWTVSEVAIQGVYNPDWTLYGIDAQYVGPCAKPVGVWQRHGRLFFDDCHEPAASFRCDPHHHRFSFAYTGTGDKLVLFLEVPSACASHKFWHSDTMTVTMREMSPADRADMPASPPAPETLSVEEELRQSYLDRIRALKIEFGGRRHLDDTQWVEQYTKKHLHDLLKDRRRIMNAHTELHADPDFVSLFTKTDPALYARVTWEYRALCLAEELEPGSPVRPKLTPEERQAKFERYRERALERDRIQAEDRMAAVRQKLDLVRQFRQDLDAYDVDEEERDRIVKEFEDDLLTSTEEHTDGNFKKL